MSMNILQFTFKLEDMLSGKMRGLSKTAQQTLAGIEKKTRS